MRLNQLEIIGFKSFAKRTALEFPGTISAIVGPNGSGKSNVAEAIRWVLGEQSLKAMRGKRGEDLIFHGSGKKARMSKAQVTLAFDNPEKKFIDFNEIRISRAVYRDGTNDYTINDSKVRLKDIVELILKMGFSRSAHNIIGQGESDRVLHMSLVQRKEAVEHALGLEIYHFKKIEAQKKLDETQENLKQSMLLRRELAPHLHYLEEQTRKARASSELKQQLQETVVRYIASMKASLAYSESQHQDRINPLLDDRKKLESDIVAIKQELSSYDAKIDKGIAPDFSALHEIERQMRSISVEFGKLEGQLAVYTAVSSISVDQKKVLDLISSAQNTITKALDNLDVIAVHDVLKSLQVRLADFIDRELTGASQNVDKERLENQKKSLEAELVVLETKRQEFQKKLQNEQQQSVQQQQAGRELRTQLDIKIRQLGEVKDTLNQMQFMAQHIELKRQELEHISREYVHILATLQLPELSEDELLKFDDNAQKTSLREIEKIKIRLEEAGGIDDSVIKEYEDTKSRDEFLAIQIEDLQAGLKTTKKLLKDLEEQLEKAFREGLATINNEFDRLFGKLFEGAHAALELLQDEVTEEFGLAIDINIPRKRIRNLHTLSGGERALTSVALLFALSQSNPPPFLVLDEVDAALDEANSARFGRLLQELAGKTQLIIITHNRETMRHASALYGVTMGSDGISTLLSVKFEEAEGLATSQ